MPPVFWQDAEIGGSRVYCGGMETLFILGREPELSLAELEAVAPRWDATVVAAHPNFAVLRTPIDPLPARSIDRLGGSIKQAEVVDRWDKGSNPIASIIRQFTWSWMSKFFGDGRVEFGVSVYGLQAPALSHHFLKVKKEVKEDGRPVRYVISKEPQLSAVTVQRNGLLKNGREFILVVTASDIIVAKTVAVQDYQSYGLRDFGRPAADPKSGMLPPKVCQIMLNIAGVNEQDTLLDPFCGSGTVLQEALLLGVKHVFGCDTSRKAVKDAQENIRWLLKEYPDIHANAEITLEDARMTATKPSVIVTEPYLGKPLRGHEPEGFINQEIAELDRLYIDTFRQWRKMLKPEGRVIMVWPEFVVHGKTKTLRIDDIVAGMGFSRQSLLHANTAKMLGITNPHVLVYGRPEAKVRRQVRMWRVG